MLNIKRGGCFEENNPGRHVSHSFQRPRLDHSHGHLAAFLWILVKSRQPGGKHSTALLRRVEPACHTLDADRRLLPGWAKGPKWNQMHQ